MGDVNVKVGDEDDKSKDKVFSRWDVIWVE